MKKKWKNCKTKETSDLASQYNLVSRLGGKHLVKQEYLVKILQQTYYEKIDNLVSSLGGRVK